MPKLSVNERRDALTDQGRLLQAKHVLKMWPVSRKWLERHASHPKESERIPSYKVAGKRLYPYDGLMHWLESHRSYIENSNPEETNAEKE